jgi:5-formyltetrahydrofolate cyclo-ligase
MVLQSKKQVRLEILHNRNKFLERHSANLVINQRFQHFILPLLQSKDTIGAYYPINSELDILPILTNLFNADFNISLPVISDLNEINFYPWHQQGKLQTSRYASDILEPLEQKVIILPSVIIAPLTACDIHGNRIGSGRAMYDKYIHNLKHKVLYIGLCYDFQLLDKVPTQAHDQPLDLILTDKRFINNLQLE